MKLGSNLNSVCNGATADLPYSQRYNPTIPFSQNVELTEPILSRFDVLCVVKDTVDPVKDDLLARFVVGSHLRSHPKFDEDVDEQRVGTALDADVSSLIQPCLRGVGSEAHHTASLVLHRSSRKTCCANTSCTRVITSGPSCTSWIKIVWLDCTPTFVARV